MTTEEGVTEYQYDEGGRLLSVTEPNGDTVSYTYDGYGNRLTMSYPDGKTVKYTYDEMNRLISVKGVDGATTEYEYDALGQRIATDGAKEDTTYAYDEMGNLISQTTTGAYDLALEYAYDLSGRMTKESRTENGATLESGYEYDLLGQLTAFERSDGITESYTYNPVGNMLTKTANGVKTRYTYNAANQLISDGENRYVYDKNGNLVQKGNTKYSYNALNLLQNWTDGEHTETYSYNANGLLSSVTNAEGTTALTWDVLMGDGVVIAAQNGESTTTYTYGLERISAQTGNRKTEYIYDGRGSVAAELSYNNSWYTLGGVLSKKDVVSKSYTPFGEQIGEQVSGFGYNGEYYNAATGMVYLRARFYEPEMNRFSQKDILRGSITNPCSLNRYSYVQNDPVNFIDPSGQSLKSAWNMVKNSVTNTVKNIVSNPVQAVKSAAKAVVNAVTHPVKTVTNAAKSVGNAVRTVYNEVRTPDSQSKYASPATNRGTASASSSGYAGSSGGSYASSLSASGSYTSSGVATSYYNSSYQTGKDPSPDAPRIEDVTANVTYCNATDVASIFRSQFAEYGSAFVVLGSISAAEPTPFGEAITGLFALGVTVIAAYEAGKAIYKAYKDGVFIDLDEDALPRIITDPSPEIHKDVIEKLPLPDQNSGTNTETLPLPDGNKGSTTTIPLPDEKTDLILQNKNMDTHNWGNIDTLEDHFDRHGDDVGATSQEDYARIANDFYNNRENYQVKVDARGVIRVYDPVNNIFASYNADGTTRTLFSPTNGQDYFDSQPGILKEGK